MSAEADPSPSDSHPTGTTNVTTSEDEKCTATRSDRTQNMHPIAESINKFIHFARDVEQCVVTLFPVAIKLLREEMEEIQSVLKESLEFNIEDSRLKQITWRNVSKAVRRTDRLSQSQIPDVLVTSLYLGLFREYDAYVGNLLKAIYSKKPELFNRINRAIPVAEVLSYTTFDELKSAVLDHEIEAFRRKSYTEQFDDMESTFNIKLKAFETWPQFVECAQRRNLFTHCDGIVSEQYLKLCQKAGYKIEPSVPLGHRLELTPIYI